MSKKQLTFRTFAKYCMYRWRDTPGACWIDPNTTSSLDAPRCNAKRCPVWKRLRCAK